LIPFAKPEDTIDYLRSRLNDDPSNLLVMIDDGEKFGVWPNTYKPIYEDGWLERFFGLLSDNREWIEMRHCAEFMEDISPRRLIHVPNNSYFEMSIWSLPARKASRLKALTEEAQSGQEKRDCLPFIRGGIWRGFLSKYPESNMMQKWMLKISNDLEGIIGRGETTKEFLLESKTHLLRGQCNCPYWHGVFGGLYLPHLRHAVYSELVAAQRKLDQLRHREADFLRTEETDLDCDGRKEIILNNRYFTIVFKPSYGGSIPLLAFKNLDYNFQNTLSRRYEHYHDEIIAASVDDGSKGTSIHELKRDTPDDVKHSLSYDWHLKYSLLDHMFDENVSVDNIYTAQFRELGDFVDQPYEHKILQTPSEISVTFTRDGHLHLTDEKVPLLITKNIYFRKDEARLRAVYKYKNMSQQKRTIYPGIEWNFFLLGGDDERKSYKFNDLEPVTPLDQKLTAENVTQLEIEDGVLGFRLTLKWNNEGGCFVVPVKTVSQSEGGYDLIFQGSSVIPHWSFDLEPDEEATIALTLVAEKI
jgi:alpha-amylase